MPPTPISAARVFSDIGYGVSLLWNERVISVRRPPHSDRPAVWRGSGTEIFFFFFFFLKKKKKKKKKKITHGNIDPGPSQRLAQRSGDFWGQRIAVFQDTELNQLPRYVLGNLQGLSHSAALGDQALQIIAGLKITAFFQRLDANRQNRLAQGCFLSTRQRAGLWLDCTMLLRVRQQPELPLVDHLILSGQQVAVG